MSTEIIAGWLKDNDGNKFSPKTLVSQVINDDGTQFNPAKYVKKANPVNLLDNSDFRNPVNQRNVTAKSGTGYWIDRWNKISENGYFQIPSSNDYILLQGGPGDAWLQQSISHGNSFIGKKLTFAVCDDKGNVYCGTNDVTDAGDQEFTRVDWGVLYLSKVANDVLSVSIVVHPGYAQKLVWAALYEGEYTAENLPEYHPKGYAHELLECQRYYVEIDHYALGAGYSGSGNDVTIFIQTPIQMRAVPTIICNGAIRARYGGAEYYTLDSCYIAAFDKGYSTTMRLVGMAISGIATYQVVAGYATSKFALSADL